VAQAPWHNHKAFALDSLLLKEIMQQQHARRTCFTTLVRS